MITTETHPDATRTVSYFGRVLGHYGPVRYKRTHAHARAWRCVTVLGALGYARNEADARRWLMEMVP
jgi:hypothetical protein